MYWPIFFFLVSLLGLIIASYTDLKERIVRNKLSYSLIALGLVGHAVFAFLESDPMIFVYSAGSAVVGFGFAYLLWKMGVWAGGDVKLFTGIAALNPFNPNILLYFGVSLFGLNQTISLPIFFLSFFMFSVFAALPYGILISVHGLLTRSDERKKLVQDLIGKAGQTIQGSAAIVGIAWLLSVLGITEWMVLPLLIVMGLIRAKRIKILLVAGLLIASLYSNPIDNGVLLLTLFGLFFGLYILINLYSVSKQFLKTEKRISELEEGDIIAESFVESNGQVQRIVPLEIKRIIKYFTNNRLQELLQYLQPKGRMIASSRKARGVTDEELEELNRLVKERKIQNSVLVKLSAPFVPAMLIAYLALNIGGDVLWLMVF
tara:strand:- start:12688 stop:13812 length:1125 start_codon:yes stop_codon:yes gene_type:complete